MLKQSNFGRLVADDRSAGPGKRGPNHTSDQSDNNNESRDVGADHRPTLSKVLDPLRAWNSKEPASRFSLKASTADLSTTYPQTQIRYRLEAEQRLVRRNPQSTAAGAVPPRISVSPAVYLPSTIFGLFWRPWGLDLTHRCGRFAGATTPFLLSGWPFWTSSITRYTRAPRNAGKSNGYSETRPRAGSPK